jgi:hypothetical protein
MHELSNSQYGWLVFGAAVGYILLYFSLIASAIEFFSWVGNRKKKVPTPVYTKPHIEIVVENRMKDELREARDRAADLRAWRAGDIDDTDLRARDIRRDMHACRITVNQAREEMGIPKAT